MLSEAPRRHPAPADLVDDVNIVWIGEHFTDVKQAIDHGQWLPWLEAEFGWTDRTARRFIEVYELVKLDNWSILPSFDVSALYLLAVPRGAVLGLGEVVSCLRPQRIRLLRLGLRQCREPFLDASAYVRLQRNRPAMPVTARPLRLT